MRARIDSGAHTRARGAHTRARGAGRGAGDRRPRGGAKRRFHGHRACAYSLFTRAVSGELFVFRWGASFLVDVGKMTIDGWCVVFFLDRIEKLRIDLFCFDDRRMLKKLKCAVNDCGGTHESVLLFFFYIVCVNGSFSYHSKTRTMNLEDFHVP